MGEWRIDPVRPKAPLPAAVAAIPLLLLVSMLWNFAVDVPYWDDWELVSYFQLIEKGRLSLGALWAQHSEHRLLLPRAIMLALARVTGWDLRYEMALSVAVAIGSASIWAAVCRRGAARANTGARPWLLPLFALVFFSLRQWENWIWGWQLQIHLNVFAVLGGAALAARQSRRWPALVGAAGLGLVAQYSFASGLLYWPALGVAIALDPEGRARRLLFWTAAAAASVASYLHGYVKPSWTPNLLAFVDRPYDLIVYLFAYLGSPLAPEGASGAITAWAVAAGLAGAGLLAHAVREWTRVARRPLAEIAPYVAVAAYALAAAGSTAVGRVGLGPAQALVSRYVTIAQLLWLSVAALLGMSRSRTARAALAGIAIAVSIASVSSADSFVTAYRRLGAGRAALLAHEDTPALAVLYPEREVLLERARVLKRLGLSLYRR